MRSMGSKKNKRSTMAFITKNNALLWDHLNDRTDRIDVDD
jgi:hypothetical protein